MLKKSKDKIRERIKPDDLIPLKYSNGQHVKLDKLHSEHDGSGCVYDTLVCFFYPKPEDLKPKVWDKNTTPSV